MTENTNTFAARLRELSRLASAGPWHTGSETTRISGYNFALVRPSHRPGEQSIALVPSEGFDCAEAALIVALRNHADRLADLVERVEAYRALVGDAVLPTTTTDKGIAIYAAKSAMLAALDALCGGPKS